MYCGAAISKGSGPNRWNRARKELAKGQTMQLDTTVSDTNIHDPSDNNLSRAGIQLLTRTMKRIVKIAATLVSGCEIE